MEQVNAFEDWEYRAEGNLHIVVANKETKQVLRLLKCCRDEAKYRDTSALEASENELSFVRHIARPLMKNSILCFPMHLVSFDPAFLKNIARRVDIDRPTFRLHKVIDESCKYGVLMPDFCQVLPLPPSNSGVNISIEIKPKQGFIPSGETRCRFSQSQHRKLQSKACEGESAYCPVDLFSGSKKRMHKAIKAMIRNPQSNLRVFRNGTDVFSQELLKAKKCDRAEDYFKSHVLPSLMPQVDEISHREKMKCASHNFQDLLCNLLLYPVSDKKSEPHFPQYCDGGDNENDIMRLKAKTEKAANHRLCQDPSLSSNCTLGLLLSLQKLESFPLKEYHKMYKLLKEQSKSFPEKAEELSLDGPYDAPHWQKIVDDIRSTTKTEVVKRDLCKLGASDMVSLLGQFLIATSFKDCSVIMTFQLKSNEEIITNQDRPLTIKTRHGQEYWASLALVDCDPKPASRIPQYYHNACM